MSLPMVCVTLGGHTVKEMVKQADEKAESQADIFEVRFDQLYIERVELTLTDEDGNTKTTVEFVSRKIEDLDVAEAIEELKKSIDKPVIFTCRPRSQGGQFPGTEKQRLDILGKAIESNVSWIDLEIDIAKKARQKLVSAAGESDCKIIASVHDIETTPTSDDIIQYVVANEGAGDVLKLCYLTQGHGDGLNLFEAAWKLRDREKLSYCVMGTGVGGDWPRIHAPLLSQSIVYTTLDESIGLGDKGLIHVSDLLLAWEMLGYCEA